MVKSKRPGWLNKGRGWKFCIGSWVQQETPEEALRTHRPKLCEYNDKDEDNSPKIPIDINRRASSQKFRN